MIENIILMEEIELFWRNIVFLCKDREIKQSDLLKEINQGTAFEINFQKIIESDFKLIYDLDTSTVIKIAKYFNCSIDDLIKKDLGKEKS